MALPHANHSSEYTERGTAIHAFLEDVSAVGRDAALECVPDEFRDVCEALNLDGLDLQLSLGAEIAIAYDVLTDTARELGRGEGRKYDDVKESEIPCTLDVVGVREVPRGRRGLIVDWKSGFTTGRKINDVLQLDFGALAAARCYGLDVAEVQLVHVREDSRPWVQRRTVTSFEIDAFAGEVRDAYESAVKLRARLRAGDVVPSWRTGPWCHNCPSWSWCPAQTNQIKALLSGDEFDGVLRTDPIPESTLGWLWDRIGEAQRTLSILKGKVIGAALVKNVRLPGNLPTGEERWLGLVIGEGNDKLDGDKAFDVLAELHGEPVAALATKRTATQKDVVAAIKRAVPRGKGAAGMRVFMDRMKEIGGVTNKITSGVKEWSALPAVAPAPSPPALEAGTPFDSAPRSE